MKPAEWIREGRLDLTEWVVHFVHRRDPDALPEPFCNEGFHDRAVMLPTHFGDKHPMFWELDELDDYLLEPDAEAFSVLRKIIADGFLRSGWAFRKKRATIYGKNPAACFTEMPLYALLNYATKRSKTDFVDVYAVAVRRNELFRAGARQVIYGLSEVSGTQLFLPQDEQEGFRSLHPDRLPPHEQYRYVATDLTTPNMDWTHEREWRWSDSSGEFDPPGLPVWLQAKSQFSEVLVLVKTVVEVEEIREQLKMLYDAGYNRHDLELHRETLLATKIVALEQVSEELLKRNDLRLEDLPVKTLPRIAHVEADSETLAKVGAAVHEAREAAKAAGVAKAKTMPRDVSGMILDVVGFATVRTENAHSSITAALVELGIAKAAVDDSGYALWGLNLPILDQSISVNEATAFAAAEVLQKRLKQEFYVHARLD